MKKNMKVLPIKKNQAFETDFKRVHPDGRFSRLRISKQI